MCAPTREKCASPMESGIVVIKIGGSVLTGLAAYHRAAAFLRRRSSESPGGRWIVVASAQHGHTDALLQLAGQAALSPDPAALDLLWATGELRSVGLLTLCLRAREVNAAGLNVHETGLTLSDGCSGPAGCTFTSRRLLEALAGHSVVVVPGFLAVRPSGAMVSLGRGGSDLTAVLLAAHLGARRCELIKDVAGYFDRDPHRHADAAPIPALSFERALEMAGAGCDLVQREALEAAAQYGLPLVVGSLDACAPRTRVGLGAEASSKLCTQESQSIAAQPDSTSIQQETTP